MKRLKLKIAMVAVVLAQNEGGAPQIPCIYEKNSTCYYQVKDALGFIWNAQTDEMKHI